MPFPRASGVLLHPTSLPARFGIGDLGPAAHQFVDFLARARQRLWQVLPLGPTGYGDSPYQALSAFAGNPLLISIEQLVRDGLLTDGEMQTVSESSNDAVDFRVVLAERRALWPHVLERVDAVGASVFRGRFDAFCEAQAHWLDDFALFMVVKEAHDQRAWTTWESDIAHRNPSALARWTTRCARDIRVHKLTQFLFSEQWQELRAHCRARSIGVIGDLPIFVAHDSADVWSRRDLFRLDASGRPTVMAGVPPDYFSETGQLWGNPHYRWDALARTGYAWWIERIRVLLAVVDRIRVDHFRGFEAAWEIPADAETAMTGTWEKGPGAALFHALQSALHVDQLPFIAENLGVITPEVESLRSHFGLPGMAILQFAFGTDPQAPTFRPHNYAQNLAAYTGTHDNDTTIGWWTGDRGHGPRSDAEIDAERAYATRYLGLEGREVHWEFIRAVLGSVADTAIVPAQDLLGLGTDARMNRPGVAGGNWRWRLRPGQLTDQIADRLALLTTTYERT